MVYCDSTLVFSPSRFHSRAHIAVSYIIINLFEILVVKIYSSMVDGGGGGGMKMVK